MKTKHLINLIIGLIGAFFMSALFLFPPPQMQSLDSSLRDIFFQIRGEIPTSDQVVIIDIDEKSLAQLGQWPWERNLIAQLLEKLAKNGAGMIGMDMVFAEADKTSPAYINQKHQFSLDNPIDYDAILAETVANTPTILGYVFKMTDATPQAAVPSIPAIVIEQGASKNTYLLTPKGVLPNIPIIQSRAYSSGFFNNVPDPSGMVRSVPLVMKYQGVVYPSLALEMLRIGLDSPAIKIRSSETGVDSIQLANVHIPTDRYGGLFVNYRGPGHSFPYISAVDILNGNFDPERIKQKWVLIGTSATGLLDLRAIPFDNVYPGVEVHANVIDNILQGDFLSQPAWIDGMDLALILAVFLISYLIFNQLSVFWLVLASITSFSLLYIFLDYMLFNEGLILNILLPFIALLLAMLLATLSSYFFETRQKNLVKSKLASKVSPSVMSEILKNESLDIMQGQTREITVFFSDLRDFTRLSESMPDPQTLIAFLNEYTTEMTDIIVKRQATVDKFIGDAIMAYWNAPVSVQNHADLAVTASLEQLQALPGLNRRIKQNPKFEALTRFCESRHIEPIQIGIGLNTGEAVVGEMGSAGRSDYTVIGDTVNLGSRIESLCKYYGSTLNISNQTKQQLQKNYIFRFLDTVTVQGKIQPVDIWQVHDFGQATGRFKMELDSYHKAIECYQNADFHEALKLFTELASWPDLSNTKIYSIYIERCSDYIERQPENFNAIHEHTAK